MKKSIRHEILLSLDATSDSSVSGSELLSVIGDNQINISPATLLANLLELEELGLISLDRKANYAISLSDRGRQAAQEIHPGKETEATLVMVDLVSFTSFTDAFGDRAAKDTVDIFMKVSKKLLSNHKTSLIKQLGDGFLAAGPTKLDVLSLIQGIKTNLAIQSGRDWKLHAASHVGRPIKFRSDYFGRDVNLVARLCELSGPDELLFTGEINRPTIEISTSTIVIKGFKEPITIGTLSIGNKE